jgi:hypothetical protein
MDPERPIEKLLRQAAQARRTQAGAPQELPPATRRILQGEVARKFAAGAPPERRSFFELFMPRLAWGAAMILGLALAVSLMLPRKNAPQQEMFFAKNDRVSAPQNLNKDLPPISTAPSENVPVRARPDSSSLARANSPRVDKVERDKDALNVERQRAEPQRSLALNEPAAAPSPALAQGAARQSAQTQSHSVTPSGDSSLASGKQKEQLADAYSGAAPSQTPVTDENMVRRRFGAAASTQSSPASAAPAGIAGGAATSAMTLSDQAAKTELANKSLAQQTTESESRGVKLKAAVAESAKRSPAPLAQVTQQFVQAATLKKSPDSPEQGAVAKSVLFSFELQQHGREVRIVDSDGSIYSGSFQPPGAFYYLDSTVSQKPAVTPSLQTHEAETVRKVAPSDSKVESDLGYGFKVTGTNLTLKEIVTFTGQVYAPSNALSLVGAAGTLNGNRLAPPELNPLPLQNSRISGKVLIGTNQEVEVNAIPRH